MPARGAAVVRALALLVLLLAVSSAPAPTAAAQDATDPGADTPPEVFLESVDVEVVNVEVRVSDRQGRPITGLTKDAFRLFEDGKRVEITYFSEVGGDVLLPASQPAAQEALTGAPAPLETPSEPAAEVAPRTFVLFLDLGHLTPTGIHKVFDDLGTFVEETLRPGDRVMVVERQQSLKVTLELTDDKAKVREVLDTAAKAAPQGLRRRSERRTTGDLINEIVAQEGPGCSPEESYQAESVVRQHAGWVGGQVEGTISALTTLARALAGLPGDKAVVYVSEGLDQKPAEDFFYALADLCPARRQEIYANLNSYDLSTAFHRMAAEANAHRVTFYPLDAGGIVADSSVDHGPGSFRMPLSAARIGAENRKGSLHVIAEETGGKAIFNTNSFAEPLVEISEDVSRYYSLGFTPRHGGDGEIHDLRVSLEAPHHDLRYRKAYVDKPKEERTVEAMLGTLMFGVESNPLGVAVAVGKPVPGGEGLYRVPIRIRVPMDAVTLVPADGSKVGRLRLLLTSLDPEGEWTPVRQREDPFRLEGEDAEAPAPRIYDIPLELPLGKSLVAVGVRDEQGGVTSYLRREVYLMTGPAEDDGEREERRR